ncbi:MAG: ice-binding family protein [Acidobacteriota bacterium]
MHPRLTQGLTCAGFVSLLYSGVPARAQTAPPLGALQPFAALGNSGVTGSTGLGTVVSGDVGSSPTPSVTNFPPSSVSPPFSLHLANDVVVQQAHADANVAYNALAAQGPGTVLNPPQLDGRVLTSGIYSFQGGAADLAATGTLTLNGPGIFVFLVGSSLSANVNSNVIGTANPCNVYWQVGSTATLNGVTFFGNVIADASVTVGAGSNLTGRALAGRGATGAVTMAGGGGNTIGGCSALIPVTSVPTLSGGAMAVFALLLAAAGFLATQRNSLQRRHKAP